MRAFLIILDSVGIGEAPDAGDYGDAGANTLAHTARAAGGLNLPALESMGLGNIPELLPKGLPIQGVNAVANPKAGFGAMQEKSRGKDTTTGHWEIAGLEMPEGFRLFPADYPSFPRELVETFENRTGRKVIGNRAASGTRIIEELGNTHLRDGTWIVYTSGDSVFQVAAHEDVVPLGELYSACKTARELCDDYYVGRVIARPFLGRPGAFERTENRKDYSYRLPEPTVLDMLQKHQVNVTTVGKLDDVFDHQGITTSFHVENNADAAKLVLQCAARGDKGLIFANLIDFDMLYGHRRDPGGYAAALVSADRFVAELMSGLTARDLLIITADHGNDPTFTGTDHTREFVPLLVYRGGEHGGSLGLRQGFYDVAQSLAAFFGINPATRGKSFL